MFQCSNVLFKYGMKGFKILTLFDNFTDIYLCLSDCGFGRDNIGMKPTPSILKAALTRRFFHDIVDTTWKKTTTQFSSADGGSLHPVT